MHILKYVLVHVYVYFNYKMSNEDTRESEALVVDDFIHDSPETLAVLETPGVDDDFSHAKKKPCLDDRDTNPKPLSIKIEIQCRVLKSDPQDLANSRRIKLVN